MSHDPYGQPPQGGGYPYQNQPGQQPYPGPSGPPIYSGHPAPPGYPVPPGTGPGPGYPPRPYEMAPATNTLAAVALGLGIAGLFVPLVCIGAIITGHLARREIRSTGEGGDAMALIGLILGWTITILGTAAIILMVVVLAADTSSTGSSGYSTP